MKTLETIKMEKMLHSYVGSNKLLSCSEVTVDTGKAERIDYVAVDFDGTVRCYEIKVSKADFHSSAACSFVGDYNYYALPPALSEELAPLIPDWVGIHNGSRVVKRPRRVTPKIERASLYMAIARSIQRDRDKALLTLDPTFVDQKNRRIAQLERELQKKGDIVRAMEKLVLQEYGADVAFRFEAAARRLARERRRAR